MKAKKLLAGLLSAAMVLSSMALPVFAEETKADDAVVLMNGGEGAAQNDGNDAAEQSTTTAITVTINGVVNQYDDLAKALTDAKDGGIVTLNKNIELSSEWTPVADFNGTLDGNGKTITGLTITKTKEDVGLFASMKKAAVKNLTIDGAKITGATGLNVGVLVGAAGDNCNTATIENVNITKATVDTTGKYVGGIVGYGRATLDKCTVSNSIITGKDQVGGLIGFIWCGPTECSNSNSKSNTITATEERAGGIAGKVSTNEDYVNISNCIVSGGSATAPNFAGGLIGQFMGSYGNYTITENTVENFTLTASQRISSFATIRDGQNDGFMNALNNNVKDNNFENIDITSMSGNWKETQYKNFSVYTNEVAQIGENTYSTLQEAFKAAKNGDTITLLTDEIKVCPISDEKDLSAAKENVTIEGKDGKTTIYGLASLNAGSKNLTFKNIEFSQTTDTLKICGEDITFENCDFNAHTVKYSEVKDGMKSGDYYTDITTIGYNDADEGNRYAKNITFNNCTFDGDDAGEEGSLPYAQLIASPKCENLTIKNCSFRNGYSAVYYGFLKGDVVVDNTTFDMYAYTIHNGTDDTSLNLMKVTNSTLNGWTSYSGCKKTIFENCNFGKATTGGYQYFVASNSTDFTGCTFTQDFEIHAGESVNKSIVWNIKDCTRAGDPMLNGTQFFEQNDTDWQNLTANFASSDVHETAKATGATITLNNLASQEKINLGDDSSYKVVVATAPQEDVKLANDAIEEAEKENANTSKQIFDISVYKTDSRGTSKDFSENITDQKVTITLGETPAASTVKVYHVNGNVVDSITAKDHELAVDGNKITFIAPSFSTYAVTYDTTPQTNITDKVGVVFSKVEGTSNEYYINLKALKEADTESNASVINRFMSADLVFKNNCATVDYEIEPAANMTAELVSTTGNSREYRFAMDGITNSYATGAGITIGKIVFSGYGTLDFRVDNEYTSTTTTNINEVHTAQTTDNIVDTYKGEALIINSDAINATYPTTIAEDEDGTIEDTIAKETANLTINIDFPNAIVDNAKAYQNMKVTISGGDLEKNLVYDLGTDGTAMADGDYVITVADTLTKHVAYTVKVEGAGYRTARYTVNMTGKKTLNFWNNVKDNAIEVVTGDGTPKNITFLAGDIVKDNQINIYDLSAVVSYFGTDNLVEKHQDYAKYDLNRDGKIDSKDIAYVLVSWGK